jgi:subtilisin family serine protease
MLAGSAFALPAEKSASPEFRNDTVLIAFKDEAPREARTDALRRLGLAADPNAASPYFVRARFTAAARSAGRTVKSAIEALRKDRWVRVVEPDWIVRATFTPNDTRYSELYGMHNTGQTGGTADADIDAPEAWDITRGSTDVKVAVIDTGVDYNHPDLAANILRDASNNVVGHDYANNDADPMDDEGHGTHCAGTVGGVGNNSLGVAGVAHTVRIIPMKFLTSAGTGAISNAILCTDRAREFGAQIMSNSWGGGGFSQLMLEAIQRANAAGILFVCAAGNDNRNTDNAPNYPSDYDVPNVISVAATDHNDVRANFSNYGAQSVDLAAPGVNTLSTVPGGGYASLSGTSMACPHVAGAAALIKAQYPAATAEQMKLRLLASADVKASLTGLVRTGGRLNAFAALENDTVRPGAPTHIYVTHLANTALRLQWRASGDDGTTGVASQYELRFSTTPITLANFHLATPYLHVPAPAPSGTTQSLIVRGLQPGVGYYFALRALDNVGNASPASYSGRFVTLPAVTRLFDNVEGTPRFTGAPWAKTTEQSFSPSNGYSDSPGGSYADNADVSLTQGTAVTLTTGSGLLSFQAKYNLEAGFDYVHIEISTDGGVNWQRQGGYSLTGTRDWASYGVPLSVFPGASVKVRFRLITDYAVTRDGVYLDDIRISQYDATIKLQDSGEGTLRFGGPSPWALTEEQSFSPTHSYTDSPGAAYTDNLDLALTQSTAVSLAGVEPFLAFRARFDLESGYDRLWVEVSPNGGTSWESLGYLTGSSSDAFNQYAVPLSAYSGATSFKVRFRLITDGSVTRDGVWLDDIIIGGPTLTAVTRPGAPASLLATAISHPTPGAADPRVSVGWSVVSQASGYNLQRKIGAGDWATIRTLSGPGLAQSYLDTNVVGNTQYTYRVIPFNIAGSTTAVVPEKVVTTLKGPGTSLVATAGAGGSGQVALSWADNSLALESGFLIEVKTGTSSSAPWELVHTTTANVTSYTYTGTPGTTYRFRVRGFNSTGHSSYSNTASKVAP